MIHPSLLQYYIYYHSAYYIYIFYILVTLKHSLKNRQTNICLQIRAHQKYLFFSEKIKTTF